MSNNLWTALLWILTGIGGILAGTKGVHEVAKLANSSSIASQLNITVYARSSEGTSYLNSEDHPVRVTFKAKGQWLAISKDLPGSVDLPRGFLPAKGAIDFSASQYQLCPNFPLGALVVQTQEGKCITSGEQGTFDLQPMQTANFLMNDVKGGYGDNAGGMQVNLSLDRIYHLPTGEIILGSAVSVTLAE